MDEQKLMGDANAVEQLHHNSHNTDSHNVDSHNVTTQTSNVTNIQQGISEETLLKLLAMKDEENRRQQEELKRQQQQQHQQQPLSSYSHPQPQPQPQPQPIRIDYTHVDAIPGSDRYKPTPSIWKSKWLYIVLGVIAGVIIINNVGKDDTPAASPEPVQQPTTVVASEPTSTPTPKKSYTTPKKSSTSTAPKTSTSSSSSSTTVSQPVQEPVQTAPKVNPFNEYKAQADAGDAAAQFKTAQCYQTGDGVAKNLSLAFQYMKAAAEAGYIAAYFELGEMYHGGRGVTKDRDKALYWYQKAANHGNRKAQRFVDNM